MESRQSSPRWAIILVVIVTFALVVGSAILQRIVFKASENYSSIFLSPTSFQSTQGQATDLVVTAESADPVDLVGVELGIKFDPTLLNLSEIVPRAGWETIAQRNTSGHVSWVAQPSPDQSPIFNYEGEAILATLRFLPKGSGVASVTLVQGDTILAATDVVRGNYVYNAAESIQSSAGTITPQNEGSLSFPEASKLETVFDEPTRSRSYGTQRILSSHVLPGPTNALVLTTLAYPGKSKVEFGPTPSLGNVAEGTKSSISSALPLSALVPNQTYYYRVIGEGVSGSNRIAGGIKTFTTTSEVTGDVPAKKSEVFVFPDRAKKASVVYFNLRNEAGATVEGLEPRVDVTQGQATIGSISDQGGYYQAAIESSSPTKQVVKVSVSAGGRVVDSKSVLLDPAFTEPTPPSEIVNMAIAWNQKTILFVIGAIILMFVLGQLFVRLARSR